MKLVTRRLLGLAVGLLGLVPFPATAWNLTRLATYRPLNFELMDVEIAGDFAYLPAGLGGLNIIDISDPSAPRFVAEFFGAGCDYGRLYAWHFRDATIYGSGRYCGIKVVNVANPSSPALLAEYGIAGHSYEHTVSYGDYLYAAVHTNGVEIIDVSVRISPSYVGSVATANAWAVAVSESGDHLYVADGADGMRIIDVSDPLSARLVGSVATSGTAKDVAPAGGYVFVAVGAGGVDMIDVTDSANPVLVANYNTSGYASRVAVGDSLVAVSDWDDVEVLAWDEAPSLELAGYKDTGGRVMAINMVDDVIYSAEWRFFRTFRFGNVDAPDLDVSTRDIDFPHVDPGSCLELPITLRNSGSQSLYVGNLAVEHLEYEVSLPVGAIEPGEEVVGTVSYCATSDPGQAVLEIQSDDSDEPVITVKLDGNSSWGLEVGQTAPDFTLPSVNGYGDLALSQLRGRVVVLAFFASW